MKDTFLPHPSTVPNPTIDFRLRGMSPEKIREYVIHEAESGRVDYDALYDAAVRALGPESPEAQAATAMKYAACGAHQVDRISIQFGGVSTMVVRVERGHIFHSSNGTTSVAYPDVPIADPPTFRQIVDAHTHALEVLKPR